MTVMYRSIVQNGINFEHPESTLELVEKPIPEAAAGQVVVHMKLRPINPTDLISIRTGRFSRFAKHPLAPGSEGYGIVHSVGDGVTKWKAGDRVVPFMWEGLMHGGGGSWQEYVCVRENMLAAVPDSISDEVAAQFVINPWTVYGMVKDLAVPKGEYILQTAAGSVLGRQVIQLAKHWGIKTINVVRRPEQAEELKVLGADEVICSTTEDIVTRVKEITAKKLAYGSLDCVGGTLTKVMLDKSYFFKRREALDIFCSEKGAHFFVFYPIARSFGHFPHGKENPSPSSFLAMYHKSVLASTRRGGHVFVYGILSGDEAVVGINDLLRQVHVTGWMLTNEWEERCEEFVKEVWKLLEAKVLEPYTGGKFDLADFKEAIRKSEEVGRGGKVLLTS